MARLFDDKMLKRIFGLKQREEEEDGKKITRRAAL